MSTILSSLCLLIAFPFSFRKIFCKFHIHLETIKYLGYQQLAKYLFVSSGTDASVKHFSLKYPQNLHFCRLACKVIDANQSRKILIKWFDCKNRRQTVFTRYCYFFSTRAVLSQVIKAHFTCSVAKWRQRWATGHARRRCNAGSMPEFADLATPVWSEGCRRQWPSPTLVLPLPALPLLEPWPKLAQGVTMTGTDRYQRYLWGRQGKGRIQQ